MNVDTIKELARQLRDNELLGEILNKLERDAIERVISVPLNDDETRRNSACYVKAIREFKSSLAALLVDAPQRRNIP